MKKRRLIKKMSRSILSGLLCVVLAAGSVMPIEMQVLASEVQTEESTDDANAEDSEALDSALAEDSDAITNANVAALAEDSENAENDAAETVPQEELDKTEGAETEVLSEEEKETQVDSVDSEKTESTDRVEEEDKSEEIPTTQVQSTEEIKENTDEKESVEVFETEEMEETESDLESDSEVAEEDIDNTFTGSGSSDHMKWDVKDNSSGNNTLTVTITSSGDSYGSTTWVGNIDMYSITEIVLKSNSSNYKIKSTAGLFSGFYNLKKVTIENSFNSSELINTSRMFYNCSELSSISNWSKISGPKVTNMSSMFYECRSLTSVGSNFNTTNVTNMSSMFYGCRSLSDISNLNTANVTNMSSMFYECSSLTSVGDSFDTTKVTNMASMFSGCSSLSDVSGLDTSNVTDMTDMFGAGRYPSYFSGVASLDLTNFDTSKVTSMASMFSGRKGLRTLNLSSFDTKNVTNMGAMFLNCNSLTTLNLDNFDTSNVTNMSSMFSNCSSLKTLDLSGFDTRKVAYMSSMFSGCSGFKTLNLEKFNTRSVQNMSNMFSNCTGLTTLDLSCFNPIADSDSDTSSEESERSNTNNLTDTSYMFYNCTGLTDLNLDRFNTGRVINMKYMFSNCLSMMEVDLSDFDTRNVTNMFAMFRGSSALKKLDLSAFDAGKCQIMADMFSGCSSLETLDVSNFNTQNAVSMNSMFNGCSSLLKLDLSDFYTSKVMTTYKTNTLTSESYTPGGMDRMFSDCSSMTELIIDKEKFNTSQVKNMQYMFFGCSRLETLDVSGFNTSQVTDMKSMFSGCNSLTTLDVSKFNTSKVTDMTEMFSRCNTLTVLDVSKFNTSQVRNMYGMFFLCINLKAIDVTNFNLANVTDIHDMFYSCRNLQELDLSAFDLKNVTDVWNMISECVGLNVIYTPRNLGLTLALPKDKPDDKWYKSGASAVVTTMPQLNYSIMIIKNKPFEYPCIIAQKGKTTFYRGEALTLDDLVVTYYDYDGNPTVLTEGQYTTNADEIDMRKKEEQELIVSYHQTVPEDKLLKDSVMLYITGKIKVEISGITIEDSIYNAEMVSYQGDPAITDTTTNEILDITEKDISLMYGYKGTLIDGTPYPYTQNGKPPVEAGRYTLVVAVEESNLYYTGTCEIPFEIKKADLTITAEDVLLPQNFPQPQEYAYKVEGLFKSDTLLKEPSFQCVVDMAKPNVYDIIPNDADAGRNYNIIYVGGTFTVSSKKLVEITGIEINSRMYNALPVSYEGKPVAKVYDQDGQITEEEVTEYIGTPVYTYSGMQADGTVYEETSEAPINAGSYTLNVKVSDTNDKYMGTTKYSFEIRKAPVTITAEDITIKVGESLPTTFTYIAEGLLYNEKLVKVPEFRCNADTSCEGSYYIVPYDADAGMNYEIFYANGLLIVKAEGGLDVEDIPHQVYTGKQIKPDVRVFFDEKTLLTPGKDYTVKFFNNINADTAVETERRIGFSRDGRGDDGFTKGMAYVVVTGKGNYAGTVYRNFYIDPAKISEDGINEADGITLKYTDQLVTNPKKAQKAFSSIKYMKNMKPDEDFRLTLTSVKATVDGKELAKGSAFFEKNVPVIPANSSGSFALRIEGINNYRGTLTKTVYVTDKAHLMKNAKITLGKNLKDVTFVNGGVRLTPAHYDESGKIQYLVGAGTFGEVSSLNDAFTVYMGKECLKYGADKNYTVRYKNNDKVGTATMIVEGKGEYMGTKTINFKISGAAFTAKTITVNNFIDSMPYTGKECKQDNIVLTDSSGIEMSKSGYTVTYKNNINKGTATMTLTAKPESGYKGSFQKKYKIMSVDIAAAVKVLPKNAAKDKVERNKDDNAYHLNGTVFYTKNGVKPIDRILLILGAGQENPMTLVEGKDYTVKYTNNNSARPKGTPTMTITGKGSLTGSLTVTFNISKAPFGTNEDLSVTADSMPYKPNAQESSQYQPKIKVTDGKTLLKENKDYIVKEYVHCSQKDVQIYLQAKAENKSESELQSKKPYAVIAATDASDYTGTMEIDLTIYDTKIEAKNIYVVIIDDENYSQTTYTGKQIKPSVEVYYGDAQAVKEAKKAEVTDQTTLTYVKGKYKLKKLKLKVGRSEGDYTLAYGDNIKAGKNTGSIFVTGTGRYGGTAKVTFTIQKEDVFGSNVESWSQIAKKLNLAFMQTAF